MMAMKMLLTLLLPAIVLGDAHNATDANATASNATPAAAPEPEPEPAAEPTDAPAADPTEAPADAPAPASATTKKPATTKAAAGVADGASDVLPSIAAMVLTLGISLMPHVTYQM